MSVFRLCQFLFQRFVVFQRLICLFCVGFSITSINVFSSPSAGWIHADMACIDAEWGWYLFDIHFQHFSQFLAEGSLSYCSSRGVCFLDTVGQPYFIKRGSRTILDCSANACKMSGGSTKQRKEINLKPRVSSKRCAALIRPRFPSLIRSEWQSPGFGTVCYRHHKRRLALVKRSNALITLFNKGRQFYLFFPGEMSSTLPISWEVFFLLWDSTISDRLRILSCLMLIGNDF